MQRVRCLAPLLLIACTQPRSATCKDVCKREADCVDSTNAKIPFDEKECIAACAVLESDVAQNGARVKRHADCVNSQQSCSGVLNDCP